MDLTFIELDATDSTNSEAARRARLGAREGICIIARQQSAGRGRHGREWVSETDAGLYFSIILRPELAVADFPLITLMAGVAAFETLAKLDLTPDIKWVNDLLVGDKKIGGILAEAIETDEGLAVILGIGINVETPKGFAKSTSINAETARSIDRIALGKRLAANLAHYYEILQSGVGGQKILALWAKRSSYHRGKPVRVTLANETIEGVTDGLEKTGALRVKLSDGSVTIVTAGDVEQLRAVSLPPVV